MARKIALRRVPVPNGPVEGWYDYGEEMKNVLRYGHPQRGLNLDEVIRCVAAQDVLEEAIAEGKGEVIYTEEQYRTLREKLDQYPFPVADRIIAEFGLAVRDAEEIK